NGTTKYFIVASTRDYSQVLAESDDSDQVLTNYLYGLDLISQASNNESYYYLYDGLGSTQALTDSSETVTDTYDYQAFGQVLNQTGETENSYLFTGEQYDSELDNYYLRARYYDQEIGRLTQLDTYQGRSVEPASQHKYLYAYSEPVNNIDPSGNITLSNINATLRINGILARQSSAVGQSALNRFLVNRVSRGSGESLGLVGDMIVTFAREAFLGVLTDNIQSQASKRVMGTFAHTRFEKKILEMKKTFNKKFKKFGLSIDAEVFFVNKNGKDVPAKYRREKGSLGLDVVILQRGKPILAFDLKTGAAMSKSRGKKLKSRFMGADIFEIQVSVKK
ncbi:RHS repeat-associated core domain-containing protein, partial [Colwellia sp. D2M02]|uniref:RHS repeat-associated core domain-containing protein n=1 Tax=Colwellia sp. D2M02 TaxID=2841562 RepID=UPI001C0901BD